MQYYNLGIGTFYPAQREIKIASDMEMQTGSSLMMLRKIKLHKTTIKLLHRRIRKYK